MQPFDRRRPITWCRWRAAVPISAARCWSSVRQPSAASPPEPRAQAVDYALDTFRRAQDGIADSGVKLCLEPLAPPEADFINTCDEALEILDRLAHPSFLLHLDVKAMSSEAAPVPDLIRRHAGRTGHFHANDSNLRGPGFGAVDFVPIFRALRDSAYAGWVSVEVFNYRPDPETIARRESALHARMRSEELADKTEPRTQRSKRQQRPLTPLRCVRGSDHHALMMPASHSYRKRNANDVPHKNSASRQVHDTADGGEASESSVSASEVDPDGSDFSI